MYKMYSDNAAGKKNAGRMEQQLLHKKGDSCKEETQYFDINDGLR